MKGFKKKVFSIVLSLVMVVTSAFIIPMNDGTVNAADITTETFTKNGFTLTIQQTVGNTVSSEVVEKIKEIYFTQYPKMRARYNPVRPKAITMVFDPGYDGVAYTAGTKIVYSVDYLKSNPKDVDCATHELFHVVQGGYKNYGASAFATAFCEGVADYARSVYGMYNKEGGWSLPSYSSNQAYTDSYRVTARFLTWVQQNVDSSIIYNINKTMHAGTYTDDLWVQMTGKTVDQLWNEYAANPDIEKIGLSGQKTESFGIDTNDTYRITSAESGQALTVKDNSTNDGANIQQENYVEGNTAQHWEFVYLGNGMYNIINVKSGKGLDVADGSTSNGANIQQYTVNDGGNNNQKWIVYERGSEYTLFPVCGNGTMAADLAGSSHNVGANIQLYKWNKSKAQSFIITSLSASRDYDYTLRAFNRIEAEDYTTSTTSIDVSIDESEARSGGANIGGLIAGAWTKYSGVVFDGDASGLQINYCNPSGDSYVNVYVDNMNGTPVGQISTPHNSSDWSNYSTVTGDLTTKIKSGTHDIYLEFKNSSMAGYAQNCDYFTFIKSQEEVTTEKKTYNGLSRIEAEDFSDKDGIVIDKDSNGNPKNIGGTINGRWVKYDNVVFEKPAKSIEVNYSCEQSRGGNIQIYVDSMDGTPVGTMKTSETGTNWSTYITDRANLSSEISAGTHTIYLKFETTKGYVANIDYFLFKESADKDAFSNVEGEKPDAFEGTINYSSYIGNTNDGDWARYDNVKFTKTAKSIKLRYAVNASRASGIARLYLNSMDSTPVGEFYLSSTSENSWNVFTEKQFGLNKEIPAGTYSLYLKFTPDNGKELTGDIDYFVFSDEEYVEPNVIKVSDSIKVEGYQMSATRKGSRVIGSVESSIDGKAVKGWGLIYGVNKANGQNFNISDDDMIVNSESNYVTALDSTPIGTCDYVLGNSKTATYFVRTTLFGSYTAAEYSAEYKVRAYAILADGSYVYSKIKEYSVYSVADYLYKNKKMNTYSAHQYLYNDILTVVDSSYKTVDYEWGDAIVKPE